MGLMSALLFKAAGVAPLSMASRRVGVSVGGGEGRYGIPQRWVYLTPGAPVPPPSSMLVLLAMFINFDFPALHCPQPGGC